MGGDGQTDLLVHAGPLQGSSRPHPTEPGKFKPYDVFPSFELADPNVRLVDLTGDGLSDALMTQDQHFLWFACLGGQGLPSRSASHASTISTHSRMSFQRSRGESAWLT
jgi:hypothetical protein